MIAGVSAILLLDRLDYLAGYWGLVLGEHGWAIAAPAATALASVFAATHWAARRTDFTTPPRRLPGGASGMPGADTCFLLGAGCSVGVGKPMIGEIAASRSTHASDWHFDV